MWKNIKTVAVAAALVMPVSATAASLLTFDEPYEPYGPYLEDGFKVTDNGGSSVVSGSGLLINIFGGPDSILRKVERADGTQFDIHQMDIKSIYPSVSAGGLIGGPADDMRLEGYDENGALVAKATASSQFGDFVYSFGTEFSGLTELVITGINAKNWDGGGRDIHFLIDNMLVSLAGEEDDPLVQTPLPASGLLLAFALIGAGVAAKRRR